MNIFRFGRLLTPVNELVNKQTKFTVVYVSWLPKFRLIFHLTYILPQIDTSAQYQYWNTLLSGVFWWYLRFFSFIHVLEGPWKRSLNIVYVWRRKEFLKFHFQSGNIWYTNSSSIQRCRKPTECVDFKHVCNLCQDNKRTKRCSRRRNGTESSPRPWGII